VRFGPEEGGGSYWSGNKKKLRKGLWRRQPAKKVAKHSQVIEKRQRLRHAVLRRETGLFGYPQRKHETIKMSPEGDDIIWN